MYRIFVALIVVAKVKLSKESSIACLLPVGGTVDPIPMFLGGSIAAAARSRCRLRPAQTHKLDQLDGPRALHRDDRICDRLRTDRA
jgi:hypothetical protein